MDALIAEDDAEALKRLYGAGCLEEPQESRAALDGRSAGHKTNAMSRVWSQFLSKVSAVDAGAISTPFVPYGIVYCTAGNGVCEV